MRTNSRVAVVVGVSSMALVIGACTALLGDDFSITDTPAPAADGAPSDDDSPIPLRCTLTTPTALAIQDDLACVGELGVHPMDADRFRLLYNAVPSGSTFDAGAAGVRGATIAYDGGAVELAPLAGPSSYVSSAREDGGIVVFAANGATNEFRGMVARWRDSEKEIGSQMQILPAVDLEGGSLDGYVATSQSHPGEHFVLWANALNGFQSPTLSHAFADASTESSALPVPQGGSIAYFVSGAPIVAGNTLLAAAGYRANGEAPRLAVWTLPLDGGRVSAATAMENPNDVISTASIANDGERLYVYIEELSSSVEPIRHRILFGSIPLSEVGDPEAIASRLRVTEIAAAATLAQTLSVVSIAGRLVMRSDAPKGAVKSLVVGTAVEGAQIRMRAFDSKDRLVARSSDSAAWSLPNTIATKAGELNAIGVLPVPRDPSAFQIVFRARIDDTPGNPGVTCCGPVCGRSTIYTGRITCSPEDAAAP